MTADGGTRFAKGQSGNPAGRPRKRRPDVSAFDIIFDKTLTVNQNGIERQMTVDEALQIQTYQAALKGSRMAIRTVLRMIEKREVAMAKLAPRASPMHLSLGVEYDSTNAKEAMRLLGMADYGEEPLGGGPGTRPFRLSTWVAQAAISRPGRRKLTDKEIADVRWATKDPDKLRWPRVRRA
jgi:hypothetical protein